MSLFRQKALQAEQQGHAALFEAEEIIDSSDPLDYFQVATLVRQAADCFSRAGRWQERHEMFVAMGHGDDSAQ